MDLTDSILDTTARLAALDLTADEKRTLRKDLGAILDYVERLRTVPAEAVEAPDMVFPALRADEPRPGLERNEALAQATGSDGETFSVPPVLDTP
ncbi:MAG: Asp-tRNA(Asn)/Glu-tRNA(Gln) amidotransferase subunit GatC [Polyangiaceae bacterium]